MPINRPIPNRQNEQSSFPTDDRLLKLFLNQKVALPTVASAGGVESVRVVALAGVALVGATLCARLTAWGAFNCVRK